MIGRATHMRMELANVWDWAFHVPVDAIGHNIFHQLIQTHEAVQYIPLDKRFEQYLKQKKTHTTAKNTFLRFDGLAGIFINNLYRLRIWVLLAIAWRKKFTLFCWVKIGQPLLSKCSCQFSEILSHGTVK
jgi:hypothetical protein